MFSNSGQSSSNKRSRKNRFANNFSIECLERREMFAADLGADMGALLMVNSNIDSPPAAVAAPLAPPASGPVAGPTHFGADKLQNQVAPVDLALAIDLPTLGATFDNGVLTVTGTHGADNVFIYASEGSVYVREVVKELTLLTLPASQLTSIAVNANGGDDWVKVDNDSINVTATINGGAGNDSLQGGAAGDILDGGSGNDRISGYGSNDALSGGDGNDVLYGGDGKDWLSGDDGNDSIYGEAGKDWLQGGYGTDMLVGGDGDDKTHQDYAPGGEPMGQVASAISWDDVEGAASDTWEAIEDGASDVGNFLIDVGEWTLDRVLTLFRIQREWVLQLENRFVRLGDDLATTFSNYPWEAEFWHGLGHVTLDVLEIVGVGEFCQYFFAYNMPWQRGMTEREIDVARSVFGDSIDYNMVRINENSLMNAIGNVLSPAGVEAHVFGYVINSNGNISDATMIHELVHIWQYTQDGMIYIPEALGAQSGEGYEYGGVDDLREKMDAGKGLSEYNREQQGDIFEDYFIRREELEDYYELPEENRPSTLSADDLAKKLEELNVYIYFVREVSTLDTDELDVTDPLAPGESSGNPAVKAGDFSRLASTVAAVVAPERRGASDDTDLARESVFAQLSTPTMKSPIASSLVEEAERGTRAGNDEAPSSLAPHSTSANKSSSDQQVMSKPLGGVGTKPVSTRALDRAFGSLA